MDKSELRRAVSQKALTLTEAYRSASSGGITAAVLALPEYRQAASVFIYVSLPREPDTRTVLEDALASGKTVYVPKCLGNRTMLPVRIRSLRELTPGTMGIPEPPVPKENFFPERMDLAIVPCVCATRDGRRLGHGAGYYDVFLHRCSVPTVCLCFDALLQRELPVEEHDVMMDCVITESGIYRPGLRGPFLNTPYT